MRKVNNAWFLIFVCGLLAFSSLGCDAIKAIYEQAASSLKSLKKQPEVSPPEKHQQAAVPEKEKPLAANTLAQVGAWSITSQEFEERLKALKEVVPEYDIANPEARRLVLDELVRQQLLVLDAEQSGLAYKKEIQDAVEEFRRTLIVREVARQLTEKISVTEEEAKAFYESKKDVLIEPVQWHVREIIVSTEEKAKELLVELLKAADFAQIARQHSIGETAAQGGDLGFIVQEPFPQMGTAILSLAAGGISGIFQGPQGHYIVKLEEKKGGAPLLYDDIKEELIQNQTLMKQQQVIVDYIQTLEQKTSVKINESLLNTGR